MPVIRLMSVLAACAVLATPLANAQDLTPQQQRMKTCNATASDRELKGDERQDFMSSCLKGEEPQQLTAQQQKMRDCNRDAEGMKGDARQSFMRECLKGSAATGR